MIRLNLHSFLTMLPTAACRRKQSDLLFVGTYRVAIWFYSLYIWVVSTALLMLVLL